MRDTLASTLGTCTLLLVLHGSKGPVYTVLQLLAPKPHAAIHRPHSHSSSGRLLW